MFFGLLQRTDILGRANPGLLEVHPAGMTPSLPVHAHHAVFSKKSVFNNKRACARKTFSRLFGSVQRSRRCSVGELLNRSCDPAPGVGATVITVRREFVDTGAALFERLVTLALQHQGGGTPDIDLGYHGAKTAHCGRQRFNTDNCVACEAACQGGNCGGCRSASTMSRRLASLGRR